MPKKRHKPEEIVVKLRQVDVLVAPEPVSVRHGVGHGRALAYLNQRGAGIFAAINPMRPGARTKEHVVRIDVVMADFDHGVPASIPLDPTVKVHTSFEGAGIIATYDDEAWLIGQSSAGGTP